MSIISGWHVRGLLSGRYSKNGTPGACDTFGLDIAGELAQALTIGVVLHRDREFAIRDHAAIAVAELAADRVVGGYRYESMQDVVVDVLRHLFPALRSRQQLQPVREVAQTEMV